MIVDERYLWHVHVVHEHKQSLPHRRPIRILGSLLHVGLQVPLYVHRGGAGREVDVQQQLQKVRAHVKHVTPMEAWAWQTNKQTNEKQANKRIARLTFFF